MANVKSKIAFLCSACGDDFPKWNGQCPSCREWGTLSEFKITNKRKRNFIKRESRSLDDILNTDPGVRLSTGLNEVDRVLGGGLLSGSLILLGGNPGVGKSTLALHICSGLKRKSLYISAEESEEQVALRAKRLKVSPENLFFSGENDLDGILNHLERIQPEILIIDSIQTIMNSSLDSLSGSPSQIRDCGQRLLETAKHKNVAILIVGHVTKEGAIAGPRVLEHIVDTVLYFEGDLSHQFRILRAIKNRFGPTDEIGVFEMTHSGLIEVENPSALFLGQRRGKTSGAAVFAGIEGSHTILVEIEALVVPSTFGTPRRAVVGWDTGRLAVILAVLEASCGLQFGNHDVYLNVAGGLRISEPAADLAVAAALISALKDEPITSETVIFGEIGLSGEVRPVGQMDLRFKEAQKLGFTNAYFPGHHQNQKNSVNRSIKTKEIRHIADLICLFSITSSKRDKSSGML